MEMRKTTKNIIHESGAEKPEDRKEGKWGMGVWYGKGGVI
jgi:hypothetical protein